MSYLEQGDGRIDVREPQQRMRFTVNAKPYLKPSLQQLLAERLARCTSEDDCIRVQVAIQGQANLHRASSGTRRKWTAMVRARIEELQAAAEAERSRAIAEASGIKIVGECSTGLIVDPGQYRFVR